MTFVSFSAHIPRVIPRTGQNPFIWGTQTVHSLDVLYRLCRHVRPPGLEPGTAGSKPAVISISPREHYTGVIELCHAAPPKPNP